MRDMLSKGYVSKLGIAFLFFILLIPHSLHIYPASETGSLGAMCMY